MSASEQPVVMTPPRILALVQWTCKETEAGFKEEDFCKEIKLGWIPRVGDVISFKMNDWSEPFVLYCMKVARVEWFEDEPGIIEVYMDFVEPEQPKQEFIELMKSVGWVEHPEWTDNFERAKRETRSS